MEIHHDRYELIKAGSFGKIAIIIGAIGMALSGFGFMQDSKQFFFSYLIAYAFWTSIGLGALFFVMIYHLTSTAWGVVIRRILENMMMALPFMFAFFVPIAFGLHDLYHWSHTEAVANDPILIKKTGYLNPTFFLIRTAVYYAIWGTLVTLLYRTSTAQDKEAKPEQISRMRLISAPGMILFALTCTYAAFDWLMSLDPHWYSTIFGLYFYSGCIVSVLAMAILWILHFQHRGLLLKTITIEHYHDLGKLLFGFVVFWAYMGFSQYFLIWYANIPEETVWFAHRWPGTWKYVSLTLVFGHFTIPFILLMSRMAKRHPYFLGLMAAWILLMHWVDLYWLVMPNLHHETAHFSWMDLTTMVGIGGFYCWFVWGRFTKHPVVPVNDPMLAVSMKFRQTN